VCHGRSFGWDSSCAVLPPFELHLAPSEWARDQRERLGKRARREVHPAPDHRRGRLRRDLREDAPQRHARNNAGGRHPDGPGAGAVGASGGLQARTPRSAHPDRDDARHRFATIFAGLVITENLIGLPGLGQLAVLSIASDDFPMVMGVTVIGSMFILTANIVVDVAYAFLDPRVSY
jgi:hypothetical protein